MNRFFIRSGDVLSGTLTISGGDVNHIRNVLRMKAGDDFEAVDETGKVHTCRIVSEEEDGILSEVLFSEESGAELPNRIVLFQGLPKFDKMELIIQKAVELGVHSVVPVSTRRTVVKLDEKKAGGKISRWQTIAEAAAKQSKRGCIPEVGKVLSFSEALKAAA